MGVGTVIGLRLFLGFGRYNRPYLVTDDIRRARAVKHCWLVENWTIAGKSIPSRLEQ